MNPKVVQAYNLIKGIENVFPIPSTVETIQVGTFDMATGKFTGLETEVEGYGSSAKKFPPIVRINAVGARLQFNVLNLRDFLTVVVGDKRKTIDISANTNILTIDVGTATEVQWKAYSNNFNWRGDMLIIERPPIVGLGVFTIPALPIAIVYAPPADNPQNRATYSVTKSVGTVVGTSFGSEEATTRQAPTNYDYLNRFGEIITGVASAIEKLDPSQKNVADAMKAAASFITPLFGNEKANETATYTITATNQLEMTLSRRALLETTGGTGGPGNGDIFYYLSNATLVWFAYSGRVTLALLGWDEDRSDFMKVLRDDLAELERYGCLADSPPIPQPRNSDELFKAAPPRKSPQTKTKLDCPTLEALLRLDPFVGGGEQASLSPPRFSYLGNFAGTAPQLQGWGEKYSQVRQNAVTSLTINVKDLRKGFLSFLGIGPEEDKTVKTTLWMTELTSQSTLKEDDLSVYLNPALADGRFDVVVYKDSLFGTLAFQNDIRSSRPVVSGKLLSSHDEPLMGQLVKLAQGDKEFWTHTEADGHWSFYSSAIKSGNVRISAGKAHTECVFEEGKAIHDVVLHLA